MNQTKLEKAWPGPLKVKQLLRQAARDTDAVSIFSFGDHAEKLDGAVVVLTGHDVVQCFREWAIRNRILTPGKSVEGDAEFSCSCEACVRGGHGGPCERPR